MKKLTDQELDSVFRNAAEGYQPDFDQAAWEAMKGRLDQPRPVFWKRWMSLSLLGVMIFSAGIWVGNQLGDSQPVNKVSGTQNKESQQKMSLPPSRTDTGKELLTSDETLTSSSDPKQTGKQTLRTGYSQSHMNLSEDSVEHVNNDNGLEVTEHSNPVAEATLVQKDRQPVDEKVNVATVTDTVKSERAAVHRDTLQVGEPEKKEKDGWTNARSFYLRLMASPDLSSIQKGSPTPLGSNYALLVDYQISPRWLVSTGAIWAMKKYATDEEITYGKYTADRMQGSCRILDIPINVYYHFLPRSKVSLYGGLGLSSYIMLKEDYVYTFDFPSGSRDFTFNYEKENNEWFKMLNVSLGAQYNITPKLQLQAEPFIKVPLAGVGEWDVALSSLGIFMGLKYKIN